MHLKRNEMPKIWALPRKGTKYVVVPTHNKRDSIPILLVLRDMLKIAKTRKEAERILREGKIKVNGRAVKDEKFPLSLLDSISLDNKSYSIIIENKKFKLKESKNNEKISKVIGKRILSGGKIQINLNDGSNFITKEKINAGDSSLMTFGSKERKIIPLKENSKIIVIKGKHLGEEGKVKKIGGKFAELEIEGKKLKLELSSIMAI